MSVIPFPQRSWFGCYSRMSSLAALPFPIISAPTMFGLFFSGGCSVLPFLALLRFLDTEKLLDLLHKDLHQLWKVFQCLQKRLAFFFEPVIPFLQSFHGRGRIEILSLIVGNAACSSFRISCKARCISSCHAHQERTPILS